MDRRGQVFAFLSAALFGVSPAGAKFVVGDLPPVLLASLLYIGCGAALFAFIFYNRDPVQAPLAALSRTLTYKLMGAIVFGGILAPLCLVQGLRTASAFSASVLLNLESVTTTLFAFFFFGEHVGLVVVIGKALLLLGGVIMALEPREGGGNTLLSMGSFWIALACVFWGLDNNLTRDVDDLPPALLAGVKGVVAGSFNFFLAAVLGQLNTDASFFAVAFSLLIGAFCYGASLVIFVLALRMIGASRTSTFFATGPLFGVVCAVAFLGDRPRWWQYLASTIMAAGLVVLVMEEHEHEHVHEPTEHTHKHYHDAHHQHPHDGTEGPEPHVHKHLHQRLVHSHRHWPDIHHRHTHGRKPGSGDR